MLDLGPSSFGENDQNVTADYLDIERPIEASNSGSPMANVETYSESDETDSNDSNDTSEADDAIHGISHDRMTIDDIGRSYLDSAYDLAADGVEHSEESNPLLEALNDNDIMNSPGELRKVFIFKTLFRAATFIILFENPIK